MTKKTPQPMTARTACARIVKLLEKLPSGDRFRVLRAVEANLSLDGDTADEGKTDAS